MEVYIEYAFLQNFLFDGSLLFLALKAARAEWKWKRLLFASFFGAGFALSFPFLPLKGALSIAAKLAIGLCMCMLAMELKTKKQWGRYLSTVLFFFVFSFEFGGVLLALTQNFSSTGKGYLAKRANVFFVMLAFLVLAVFTFAFVEKLYKKRAIYPFLYDCKLIYGKTETQANGFLDSGNLAMKNGLPVCFLSPELFYYFMKEEFLFGEDRGQVCDEMQIQTAGGSCRVLLYKGEILIKKEHEELRKKVYFALSRNRISREYNLLLNARIFEK